MFGCDFSATHIQSSFRLLIEAQYACALCKTIRSPFLRSGTVVSKCLWTIIVAKRLYKVNKYIYGNKVSDVIDASDVSGVLIKLGSGEFEFRVYHDDKSFTDYQINHDDLPITINSNSLSSFYSSGEHKALDHSPEVFGLKEVDGQSLYLVQE